MHIQIDAPGAGDWVMKRVTGVFTPGWDHSFTVHNDDDEILGGIVICHYLGASATVHVAGEGTNWVSRELLWMVFDYAFNQLGCRKLLGPVKSTNYQALSVDLRGGWRIEAVIKDVYPDAHMFVLTMTKDSCPWLDYKPKFWRSGQEITNA